MHNIFPGEHNWQQGIDVYSIMYNIPGNIFAYVVDNEPITDTWICFQKCR